MSPEPQKPVTQSTIDLGRIGWLLVTGGFAVCVLVLLLKREWGYAGVSGAVLLSAAINLV